MWKVLLVTCFVGICSCVSCPHHCQCFIEDGLNTANCTGSTLTTHQHYQTFELDVLNIRPHFSGFRTKLSPKVFKMFKNIKYLNLANTSITIIPDEVFDGLNYIITIDLSLNKIKHLNGIVFKDLLTLQILLLRGNPLMLTKSDVIVSKSLRKLDMGNCGLHYIPPETFTHVIGLTALFLDGNSLQTFSYHSLPQGLWYLNLANNHIANVPIDLLRTMKSLRRIDMSGNPVKCTCHLLLLQDSFSGQGRTFENDITCSDPKQYHGQKLSKINENDLCNLEFTKKVRYMNSIQHFRDVRSNRKHNMIKSPSYYDEVDSFDVQGDQPYHSDEAGPNHDFEVMFSNDGTRRLGTHMSFVNTPNLDISDENNNKLPNVKHNNHLTTDQSSTEVEPEENDDVDIKNYKAGIDDVATDSSTTSDEKAEDEEVGHSNKELDDHELTSTDRESFVHSAASQTPPRNTETDLLASSSDNDEAKEGTTEPSVSHSVESHHDEEIEGISPSWEANLDDDVEELTSVERDSHNSTSESMSRYSLAIQDMNSNATEHTDSEEIHDTTGTSVDEIFQADAVHTTEGPSNVEPLTWPTSKSDITDYNYDAQHEDYSSVDPSLAKGTTDVSASPLTTEVYPSEEHSSSTQSSVDRSSSSLTFIPEEEGSGDGSNETSSHEDFATAKWMDEQENETVTEEYSYENVSETFNITAEDLGISRFTEENTSPSTDLTEFEDEQNATTSSDGDVSGTGETTTEGGVTEISSTGVTEISSTPDTSSPSEETSSSDSVTESFEVMNETSTEETTSYTTEDTTPISFFEVASTTIPEEASSSTDASSTTSDDGISSSSSSDYDLSVVEVTSEATKETEAASEESTTDGYSSSTTDSTPPFILPAGDDEEDDHAEEVSPSTSEQPLDVSSPMSVDTVVHVTLPEHVPEEEISSTPVIEVEMVSKTVYVDDKENIILDPTKEEISRSEEDKTGPDIAMISIIIIITLLVLIIIIISLAVVCRRTKRPKSKIRLPADPEANLGTEMQDMLLPKAPENGVKVVPKNYTNGTTATPTAPTSQTNGKTEQQKEEETPVLSAPVEDEPDEDQHEPSLLQQQQPADEADVPLDDDWEEKPEPIETVTARLTMLARPQTPVYIPKTVN